MKIDFTPGCTQDVQAFLSRLESARARYQSTWNLGTFCHRLFGDTEVPAKARNGRITVRQLAAVTRKLDKYVEDRE